MLSELAPSSAAQLVKDGMHHLQQALARLDEGRTDKQCLCANHARPVLYHSTDNLADFLSILFHIELSQVIDL